MFRWLLGTILGVVLGLVIFFAVHLGAFKPVDIVEKDVGPLQLVYKVHVGPYHKIVPVLEEVEKWAKEQNLACPQTFGEFLDNPNQVEEGRLRANCGCVVSPDAKLPELPAGFFSRVIASKKYVTVDFSGSPGIGPMKVYSKVADYFSANNKMMVGNTIEAYRILSPTEMITTYLFPMD